MRRRRLAGTAIALLVGMGALAPWAGPSAGQSDTPAGVPPRSPLRPEQIVEGDGPWPEALPPDALPPGPAGVAETGYAAPTGYEFAFRHYPTSAETNAFLEALASDYPDLLELAEIGRSSLGRPILAARVTNEAAPGAIADRPAMYIDGQHHARELISQSVALYALWWLVDRHATDPYVRYLLDTRVLYVVPSVNPDGNDLVLSENQTLRKTANPLACDDDGDGAFDEDGTTGYGYGTHTLWLYRFQQSWADANPDNPFVGEWRNHMVPDDPVEELGRFTGAYGGPSRPIRRIDDDGDGHVDEDEKGGTDANRNYESAWHLGDASCRSGNFRGETPFSEPETAAVRDLVGGIHHLSTALSLHSGIDRILHPWGFSATAELPDAWLFELVGRKGSQLTERNGFVGSPHTWTARGLYEASGGTMDYLYERLGVLAFSPEVYGSSGRTQLARLGSTGTFTVGVSTAAVYNPPPGEILATTDRWLPFALYLLAATPNVELVAASASDDALILRLENDGALPAVVRAQLVDEGNRRVDLGPTRLQDSAATWSVARAGLADGALRLDVEVEQPTGTHPHTIERARWVLSIAGDEVSVVQGRLVAPPDLAGLFPDGWWAGEEWDEPGRYHLPPDKPISVTPPRPTPTPSASSVATATVTPEPSPTATASPSATNSAEPTDTATSSPTASPSATQTASPTVTPTVPPGGRALSLPWLGRSATASGGR